MKKLPFFVVLFFSACSPPLCTQLFEIQPASQLKNLDSSYVFENDTIRIVYDFWSEHGYLSMTISNKLKVPLYINWKESSYIRNDNKINYWNDETTTTATSSSSGLYYRGSYSASTQASATAFKPQMTEFVPPGSYISIKEFILFPSGVELEKDKVDYSKTSRTDNPKKQTTLFSRTYQPDESLLRFRNYLTISTSEKFETVAHVDNSFYLGKITTMETRQFKGKCDAAKCAYPFTDARRFFINLNDKESQLVHSVYMKHQ